VNEKRAYDMDDHIAEIYDQVETQLEDLRLIRELVPQGQALRILEPFCGTGRLALPLAEDGHEVVGIDRSQPMLERARAKRGALEGGGDLRITLREGHALRDPWPGGFDLVLLGGNCFYELSTPEDQEKCVALAAVALRDGGYLYVDNNHMEGELDEGWRKPPGRAGRAFPTGRCADATRVAGTTETMGYDIQKRIVRYRRRVRLTFPDGSSAEKEWQEQCHPPSFGEVASWLEGNGFVVERTFGDRQGNAYREDAPRAIFWARREGGKRR
jgi:SAM-dependent methyltransferase